MLKLKPSQLRTTTPSKEELDKIKRRDIYFILESVLDTYNVGGIFRLADAIGVKKVYLCADTETPPNPRIKKASINTTEWVNWEYKESAKEAIEELRSRVLDIKVISIEQSKKSKAYDEISYSLPLAFVVGNETSGIAKETLKLSDHIAEIPMWGVNHSLNVIISLGIVAYQAIGKLDKE